ncbi:MAG: CoA pyrophosphatase [Xanthobacteraceae bacterium]|nr:CoA pyrophosphatase [Xanthobacteraceae bacterium]
MSYLFNAGFKALVAERCASFQREEIALQSKLKQAAVAVTLVAADDGSGRAAFILTERPSNMRNHAGQWALPGGRCDEGETAAQAALREIEEEIGLSVPESEVLGTLDDFVTRSGYRITPLVVWAERSQPLRLNEEEVAVVYRLPLDGFVTKESVSFVSIKESPRPVIRIRLMGSHLHAPTAAIMYQFCELLAGRVARVSEFEQPLFAWR